MNKKEEIEEWRDVPGYEGLYKISNKGMLIRFEHWSTKGRYYPESHPYKFKNYKGYIQTYLYKDGKRKTTTIHRLIAQAFIPNPENKDQINHKNGIKDDNRIENIEWCNQSENMRHAFDTGLKEGMPGEKNGRATLSQEAVDLIKSRYNSGEKITDISRELNINLGKLRTILYGFSWKETKVKINKRDDRADRTEEHTQNNLISNFINSKGSKSIVVVAQYTKEGKELKKFRSLNQAAIITGVPRSSIHLNIYGKASHAGGYIWKKVNVDINQYKKLLCEI